MPRAGDAHLRGGLPVSHDPTKRISYQGTLQPVDFLAQWTKLVRDTLIGILYTVTGLNLASWDDFLNSLHDGKGIDLPGLNLNFGNLLSGLLTAPQNFIGNISHLLMDGVKTVQNFLDDLRNAFVGGAGTGFSVAGLTAAASSLASQANTALTNVTSLAASLLGTPESVMGNIRNVLMDASHSVQNFLDNLHDAFLGGSSSGNTVSSVGTAASSLASTASSANTNAATAQTSADSAQNSANSALIGVSGLGAKVSALETGGESASDTFDRAISTDLGADYSQSYIGSGTAGLSGSGVMATDGSGNAVWRSGSSTTALRSRAIYTPSTMTSDYQMASIVLTTKPGAGSANYIILRADTSGAGVYGAVHNSTISFGYISGGVFTQLNSQSATISAGDLWEFWIGTSTSAREFVLRRNNGSTVYTFTESGTTTLLGAGYRNAGFGMNFPGGFGTPLPAKMGIFSFADRTP
jgi:hypothetical protein